MELRVSTDMFPEEERFSAFREDFMQRVLAMDIIDRSDGRPWAEFTLSSLGQAVFATSTATPMEFVRHRHHIADLDGHFAFSIMADGRTFRRTHGREQRTYEAGSAGFFDETIPWRGMTSGGTAWTIGMPTAALKALVRHPEDLCDEPVRPGPALCLLKDYLGSLTGLKTPLPPELADVAGGHLLDLVAAALGPTAEAGEIIVGRGVTAARIRQIREEIKRRCCDPDFDLDRVARTLGLSRRYIQQLLELTEKPFTAYLVECRLERAVAMLRDRRCNHLSVAAIAFAAGFGDVSHFNRLFRRRFGDTPSALRAAAKAQ